MPCGHLMAIFITLTVRLVRGQCLIKLSSQSLITSHPTHKLSSRDKCGINCGRWIKENNLVTKNIICEVATRIEKEKKNADSDWKLAEQCFPGCGSKNNSSRKGFSGEVLSGQLSNKCNNSILEVKYIIISKCYIVYKSVEKWRLRERERISVIIPEYIYAVY